MFTAAISTSGTAKATYGQSTTAADPPEPIPSPAPGDKTRTTTIDIVAISIAGSSRQGPVTPYPDSYYARFIPVRDGFSNAALAEGVNDPGKLSNSAGLSLDATAADARKRLDAVYAKMKASGSPFDYDSNEGVDWNTLMGDLDRRSLHAVKTNQGGHFTQQEQAIAEHLMEAQQALAMGYYWGPIRLEGEFDHGMPNLHRDHAERNIAFLERVPPEEKAAPEWAARRASAQDFLDDAVRKEGAGPVKKPKQANLLDILLESLKVTIKRNEAGDNAASKRTTLSVQSSSLALQATDSRLSLQATRSAIDIKA